jgi:hypothetical protein
MQLVAEMFERAGKDNYAAEVYDDASVIAVAAGLDPAPLLDLRDKAISREMRR